jgi:proteic killer suppression protein
LLPDWVRKIDRLLRALDAAKHPAELNFAGSDFHPPRADLKGRYAMTVLRNWRMTFGWEGEDAIDVDVEDYHG